MGQAPTVWRSTGTCSDGQGAPTVKGPTKPCDKEYGPHDGGLRARFGGHMPPSYGAVEIEGDSCWTGTESDAALEVTEAAGV